MAKQRGSITVSRNQDQNMQYFYTVMIIVQPTPGHRIVVDVDMTPDQFAKAITGLGYIDCNVDITQRINNGRDLD